MVNPSEPLSANFVLGEFLRSDTAERDPVLKEEQFNPSTDVLDNLKYLVDTTLQPLRDRLSFPIRITSGYRCPMVNKRIGGSPSSQHCAGEAADCQLSPRFLYGDESSSIREAILSRFQGITGQQAAPDANPNFYLWALLCEELEGFDVDQVIHEYGEDFGRPAWIHISASRRQNKRQVLLIGEYTRWQYLRPPVADALSLAAR